ncbi:MAG: hypothetical protein AAGA60_10815 [Cyanobacteria bacterium P01_E01_bin.42]
MQIPQNSLVVEFISSCQIPYLSTVEVLDITPKKGVTSLLLNCTEKTVASHFFRLYDTINLTMVQLGICVVEIAVKGELYWEICSKSYSFESGIMFKEKLRNIVTAKQVIEMSSSLYAKKNPQIIQVLSEIYGSTVSIYSKNRDQGYPLLCCFPALGIEDRLNRPIKELLWQPALASVGIIGESKQKCIEAAISNNENPEDVIDLSLGSYNKIHYTFYDARDGFTNWEKDLVGISTTEEDEIIVLTIDSEVRQLEYWKSLRKSYTQL